LKIKSSLKQCTLLEKKSQFLKLSLQKRHILLKVVNWDAIKQEVKMDTLEIMLDYSTLDDFIDINNYH